VQYQYQQQQQQQQQHQALRQLHAPSHSLHVLNVRQMIEEEEQRHLHVLTDNFPTDFETTVECYDQ
jgi:uncharacterized Fe-S cluster-containing radical SAM superfamily protein